MDTNRLIEYDYLSKVMRESGHEQCKAVFDKVNNNSRQKAAAMLNHRHMTFPCLFLLMPQIKNYRLYASLNTRNKIAIEITGQIINPGAAQIDYLSERKNPVRNTLKWMLQTGGDAYELDGNYMKIMDVAASVLINTYQDKSVLPLTADMIFERGKRGVNVHDLAWAAFQSRDPGALKLIAKRITSSDLREAELARKLLNIELAGNNAEEQQARYLQWLDDNDPYLYFTGESLQYASAPEICKVDLARKYIHEGSSGYVKQPIEAKSSHEAGYLAAFEPLGDEEKTILSEYSYKMKDSSQWEEWIKSPIDRQMQAARAEMEVSI